MSLRSRIVLAVAAVFATISLLTGWLMLNRAETSLRTAFDRAVQTRANWLLSLVSVDPVVVSLPAETEQMRVVYEAYGHKRELFRSPGFPDTLTSARRSYAPMYRVMTVQATREQIPDGRVSLTLAVPAQSLAQDIGQLRWLFGVGWLGSLLLACLGGYIVAGWLLTPIQNIVRQADQISNATSIDPIALPRSQDEIYQLTDSLNLMLARIRESAELQRNFFGAAAHELRTPLAVMKTGLEVTLNSGKAGEAIRPFLTGQLDEVSRLARLLDEFLTLSRPDTDTPTLRNDEIDIPHLVETCVAQLVTLTTDYGVYIKITGKTMGPSIRTDAIKLEHVLLNLMENAIKYAAPGSTIRVQTHYDTDWIIQVQNRTVRETGPTLDLLQPYFQADPLREGHGLGLWISHRLTRLIGGRLRLDWQTFTFISELALPVS
ncbi:ATP-binding protein [Spirosoma soli]|uniref:histidine kinase n=1 Tax=Spirosoma soli TaxID=1770529 RepID=A0ABW5M2S0_9BACT